MHLYILLSSALLNVRPYTNQVEHDNESTFTLLRKYWPLKSEDIFELQFALFIAILKNPSKVRMYGNCLGRVDWLHTWRQML